MNKSMHVFRICPGLANRVANKLHNSISFIL